MKFTIERADLLGAMQAVAPGIGNKNIPTINNVLIVTNGDTVSFRTTDLDQEITTKAPASISQPGTTTVPAGTLHDIAKNMAQGAQATFTLDDDADPRATLASGRSRFKLPVIAAGDFPSMPDVAGGVPIIAPAGDIARAFERVAFCASQDAARFALTGTCIFPHEGAVAVVATNSHRFGFTTIAHAADIPSVLLAPKFVGEVVRLLTGLDLIAELTVTKTMVRLTCGDTTLRGKTLDAQPPDYLRAMATANGSSEAAIDVDALKSALRRATIMATDKGRSVRMAFSAGSATVTARADSSGEAADEIDVEYDGPDVTLALVGTDLSDILSRVTTEAVRMRLGDKNTPIEITHTGEASTRYVVALKRG